MKLLKQTLKCERTLELIRKALIVGYIDPTSKRIVKANIGTPQGSVLSPLLANIVLHELDKYIINGLMAEYSRGKIRRTNPVYNSLIYIRQSGTTLAERKEALKMMLVTPRMDSKDYRRSMYIRYAYDFIYLFEGPIAEARIIKNKIKEALHNLTGLELNETLVTHLNDGFKFLGARIKGLKHVGYTMKTKTSTTYGHRSRPPISTTDLRPSTTDLDHRPTYGRVAYRSPIPTGARPPTHLR